MTGIIETVMDECVAYGFQAVPSYNTQIVPMDTGHEQRNINWTRAKRKYSASFVNFSLTDFASLLDVFHACSGSAYGFLFPDRSDYQVTNGSQGTTPGTNSTPVQLRKIYTFGANTQTRNITRPKASSVLMYQDNGSGTFVLKAGTTDATTGLFTPSTNWTAGRALRATFDFYVPVRFVSDELPSSYDGPNAVTVQAELIEVFP